MARRAEYELPPDLRGSENGFERSLAGRGRLVDQQQQQLGGRQSEGGQEEEGRGGAATIMHPRRTAHDPDDQIRAILAHMSQQQANSIPSRPPVASTSGYRPSPEIRRTQTNYVSASAVENHLSHSAHSHSHSHVTDLERGMGVEEASKRYQESELEYQKEEETNQAFVSPVKQGRGKGKATGKGTKGKEGKGDVVDEVGEAKAPDYSRTKKDNHKEVERRRRENINDGINALRDIVPNCEKAKGSILSRAAEYIQELKDAEASNIEKWTLEKLLSNQAMVESRNENESLRNVVRQLEREADELSRERNGLREVLQRYLERYGSLEGVKRNGEEMGGDTRKKSRDG